MKLDEGSRDGVEKGKKTQREEETYSIFTALQENKMTWEDKRGFSHIFQPNPFYS